MASDDPEHHLFVPYPAGRTPNSCQRCGLPPHNVIHTPRNPEEVDEMSHPPWPHPKQALSRIAREDLFMQVAELFALRSSCERGHVGAVLVKDNRIISCGYNGAPPGMQHCSEVGCEVDPEHEELGCQRTIHAEANCLLWASRMGVPTLDSVMYSTHSPCATCARLIIAAGVSKLYFHNDYRLARLDLLDQACVLTEKL